MNASSVNNCVLRRLVWTESNDRESSRVESSRVESELSLSLKHALSAF
jgi:hypothetical protein